MPITSLVLKLVKRRQQKFWRFRNEFWQYSMRRAVKSPVEPLTLEEVADRCHCPEDIEMIYKIIAHMATNDRALIDEGSCGSPRSIKVFLGECNVDDLYA